MHIFQRALHRPKVVTILLFNQYILCLWRRYISFFDVLAQEWQWVFPLICALRSALRRVTHFLQGPAQVHREITFILVFIVLEVAEDDFGGHRPGIHHWDCFLTLACGYWMPIRRAAGADWRLEKWSVRVRAPVHHIWRSSHEESVSIIISCLIS